MSYIFHYLGMFVQDVIMHTSTLVHTYIDIKFNSTYKVSGNSIAGVTFILHNDIFEISVGQRGSN